jgi:hypothetical protein
MQAGYDGRQIVGLNLHRRRSLLVPMSESGEHLATVRIGSPWRASAGQGRGTFIVRH